jgi:hypothetical protein
LAQIEEARGGEGSLQVLYRATPADQYAALNFTADYFLTTDSPLAFRVSDIDGEGPGASLSVFLNPVDLYVGGGAEPLVDGMTVEVAKLPAAPWVWFEDRYSNRALGGTITFRGQPRRGERVSLTFHDVQIGACVFKNENSTSCEGSFLIRGSLEDIVRAQPNLAAKEWPLAPDASAVGPPYVSWAILALEQCRPHLTAEMLKSAAAGLAERLDLVAARLDVALAEGPAELSMILPRTLTRADRELQVNGADALALRGLARVFSAGLRLLTAYEYFDGPLVDVLDEQTVCIRDAAGCTETSCAPDGSVELRRERSFSANKLFTALAPKLLSASSGVDFERVRSDLERGLEDAAVALRLRPQTPGLFSFQAPRATPFSDDLAALLDTIRASLRSEEPLQFANNPFYRAHLRRFFENPFNRETVMSRLKTNSVISFRKGDRTSKRCSSYNDGLELPVELSWASVGTMTAGAVNRLEPAEQLCATDAECPTGALCGPPRVSTGRQCVSKGFEMVRASSASLMLDARWPAVISPYVRRLVLSWF